MIVCLSPFFWIGTTFAFFHSIGNLPLDTFWNSMGFQIESPESFNIQMLIIWPWALFASRFLIICRMNFLEKWHLDNGFSVENSMVTVTQFSWVWGNTAQHTEHTVFFTNYEKLKDGIYCFFHLQTFCRNYLYKEKYFFSWRIMQGGFRSSQIIIS